MIIVPTVAIVVMATDIWRSAARRGVIVRRLEIVHSEERLTVTSERRRLKKFDEVRTCSFAGKRSASIVTSVDYR